MPQNPYSVWDFRKSMAVLRDMKPIPSFWLPMFSRQFESTNEKIEFDKLPLEGRRLAPFVMPLAGGRPVWKDSVKVSNFKPAYIKPKDAIDPTMPLTRTPGIDRPFLNDARITPEQRRTLIKLAISRAHVSAIERRWEWMACKAIVDAKVDIVGEDYPAAHIDFGRNADQTIVKGSGTRWGDAGVSIFDDVQLWCDKMFNAAFGGIPTRMVMGPDVWKVVQKNEEFMKHMDTNFRDPRATIERGVVSPEAVVNVGRMNIGGSGGAVIELYLYRDTYIDDNNAEVPFMSSKDVVLVASPERIYGVRCFGAIVDPHSNYRAVPIYARNWLETGDPACEYILHQSAPLMVPVNPNATLKATVVA